MNLRLGRRSRKSPYSPPHCHSVTLLAIYIQEDYSSRIGPGIYHINYCTGSIKYSQLQWLTDYNKILLRRSRSERRWIHFYLFFTSRCKNYTWKTAYFHLYIIKNMLSKEISKVFHPKAEYQEMYYSISGVDFL